VGHSLVVNEIDQDQNLIASAGDDGNVNVWDPKTKAPINNIHSEYPLLTVAFRRQIIYASGIEPVIRAWDVRSTSSPLFEIETQHTDSITSLAVDDNNLISRSQDDTIRLYEPKVIPGTHDRPQVYDGATSGNENFTIRTIVRENTIYSGSADHTVTSWDLTSKRLLRKLTGHTGTVIDVDEHEGKLASTSVDGKVILRYTNI
jgi:Prp8 binding protein